MPSDLETTNSEKVNIICDNIFAEQIEFNIKDGIKYGKMQVLMYLPLFHDNKKSYPQITLQGIFNYLTNLKLSTYSNNTTSFIIKKEKREGG